MRTLHVTSEEARVELARRDVVTIKNALNEVTLGLRELSDDMAFSARLGASRSEVVGLVEEFIALLATMGTSA